MWIAIENWQVKLRRNTVHFREIYSKFVIPAALLSGNPASNRLKFWIPDRTFGDDSSLNERYELRRQQYKDRLSLQRVSPLIFDTVRPKRRK